MLQPKMKRIGLIVLLWAAFAGVMQAQPGTREKQVKDSGEAQAPRDTLQLIVLQNYYSPPSKPENMDSAAQRAWDLMVWRVDKVWPEVQKFLVRLDQLEKQVATLDKKGKQRKAVNQEIQYLKDEFADKLKDYSRQQGEVIINLIHRQTGMTAYDLIKEHKNGFLATSYQVAAKVNGMDLKDTWDPNSEEDKLLARVLEYRGIP